MVSFTAGVESRNTIATQRKRILELHREVTLAQQHRLNVNEELDDEEEPDTPETKEVVNDISNEPTSVLRNRLFANRGEKGAGENLSTEHVLQHHRMLQDDLSDAMLGMARGLKERSIAFGEALKEDSKVPVLSFYWEGG